MSHHQTVSFFLNGLLFEYDEEKNRANIKKHGISFRTAARVFFDYDRIEFYDEQNSFDEVDMYCSPEKLSWMMRQLAGFTRRAQALIKKGTPLVEISKLKSLPRLLRMKSEIPNGDTAKMAAFEQTFSTELEKLERKYIR